MLAAAGVIAILIIAYVFSANRRAIRIRVVGAAFALQAGIAFLVLYTSWGRAGILGLSAGVADLLGYATQGTEFLFGPSASNPLAHTFAIAALPVIIFFASLVSILYYLGIMQRIVRWVGGAIGWVTGISRVESLSAAANIFVGQSESPLVVRPYLAALPPSRLFTVMCVGMAGVAGTILAAYASLLGASYLPYLLAASFMSAPGGILMAKMIMPDDPTDSDKVEDAKVDVAETFEEGMQPANIIMAAAQGAQTGVKLAVAVGAMVLAFVALVALANGILGGLGNLVGIPGLSFQRIIGYVFQPVMFLIGVPWTRSGDCRRPVRHQARAQRVRRLHRPRQDGRRDAEPAQPRDRHLRSVRLRQLQLDRHPDGGDRRPRAQPAPSDRQARHPRAPRRQPRQPDERGARFANASIIVIARVHCAATRQFEHGCCNKLRMTVRE